MTTFTLDQVKTLIDGELVGDPTTLVTGVAGIENARNSDLTFLANKRYQPLLETCNAACILVSPKDQRVEGKNYLVHPNPQAAFQRVIEAFHQKKIKLTGFKGVHPTAVIHEKATISNDVTIAPFVVIEEGAFVGKGTFIASHTYVGVNVRIGENCWIHPNVTIREESILGDRVILQPGAVIGSCGYGYVSNKEGKQTKLNQVGIVEIGDDVEIGANSTVDRARFDKTRIGSGTKVDNLVMIAHNTEIGQDCLIISQVGIAGSAKLGNRVVLAGKVGVNGHIKICDDVMVAGCSGVSKDIGTSGKYIGLPAVPAKEFFKFSALLKSMPRYIKEFKKFKKLAEEYLED